VTHSPLNHDIFINSSFTVCTASSNKLGNNHLKVGVDETPELVYVKYASYNGKCPK
jgi:hypothetical protein